MRQRIDSSASTAVRKRGHGSLQPVLNRGRISVHQKGLAVIADFDMSGFKGKAVEAQWLCHEMRQVRNWELGNTRPAGRLSHGDRKRAKQSFKAYGRAAEK